jgi:membrane-associated phospholipid phosphatase
LSVAPGSQQTTASDEATRRLRLGVTGGLMLAVVMAGLFVAALENVVSRMGIEQLDAPASRFMDAHRTAALTSIAKGVTLLGSPGVTVALAVVALAYLIWRLRWREAAAFLAISVGGGDLSYVILKLVVQRPRPAGALVHLSTYSFPSGHTVGAFTLFLGLAWIVSRRHVRPPVRVATWVAAVLITATVGASRIVLGAHYASDVIGGLALGAFWVVATATAWSAWELSGRRLGPRQDSPGKTGRGVLP